MGSPVPTPKGSFVWLVSLNGVVIYPEMEVGSVCKDSGTNTLVVTQNPTENGKTNISAVFKDVVSKIKLLSLAISRGGEVPDEVLRFIETNGDEEDRIHLLRFYSKNIKQNGGSMSRFSSAFLSLKTPKATTTGLKMLQTIKNCWSAKDVLEIALKIVQGGNRDQVQLLTQVLAKGEGEGAGEVKKEEAFLTGFSTRKFLETLNALLSLPPPDSSSPLTNVMLCSTLLFTFISYLRRRLKLGDSKREQSTFLELVSMLRADKLPMLALDECCVQCARGRMEKYGKEMELRLRGGSEGQTELLRIFLDDIGGEDGARTGEVEDKLLLTTLLIHHTIDLDAPSLSLACATLPRLVGEIEGDSERLEDVKRSRWGEEWKDEEKTELEEKEDEKEEWDNSTPWMPPTRKGENSDLKLIRENPRIRTSVAIRVVAGFMLTKYLKNNTPGQQIDPDMNPDLSHSTSDAVYNLQVALNLLRSSSTSTKAAGVWILHNLTGVDPNKARAVLKIILDVSYKAGGAARIGALDYLASRTSGGSDADFGMDVRQCLLDCGIVNIVASVLEAAVEESVGEERFYVERKAFRWAIRDAGGEHLEDNFKSLYANNTVSRGEIERHSVRVLMHMKAGGFTAEVERRCNDLANPRDKVASEFMSLVRADNYEDGDY